MPSNRRNNNSHLAIIIAQKSSIKNIFRRSLNKKQKTQRHVINKQSVNRGQSHFLHQYE